MGAITRGVANGITTSGVVLKSIINNDSFDNVTALPSSFGDGITFISSQTASASASLSFTTGLDSTYKAYKFVFINMHPATNSVDFEFNLSTDSGSNYNVTKTTTAFQSYHTEGGGSSGLTYQALDDLAQSTGYQTLTCNGDASGSVLNDNDNGVSGSLTLFNPASTTYVKHFISTTDNMVYTGGFMTASFVAGYANTTSAINAIQFRMSSGNIDDGKIYLYGIK
jgi:hypothetical protein